MLEYTSLEEEIAESDNTVSHLESEIEALNLLLVETNNGGVSRDMVHRAMELGDFNLPEGFVPNHFTTSKSYIGLPEYTLTLESTIGGKKGLIVVAMVAILAKIIAWIIEGISGGGSGSSSSGGGGGGGGSKPPAKVAEDKTKVLEDSIKDLEKKKALHIKNHDLRVAGDKLRDEFIAALDDLQALLKRYESGVLPEEMDKFGVFGDLFIEDGQSAKSIEIKEQARDRMIDYFATNFPNLSVHLKDSRKEVFDNCLSLMWKTTSYTSIAKMNVSFASEAGIKAENLQGFTENFHIVTKNVNSIVKSGVALLKSHMPTTDEGRLFTELLAYNSPREYGNTDGNKRAAEAEIIKGYFQRMGDGSQDFADEFYSATPGKWTLDVNNINELPRYVYSTYGYEGMRDALGHYNELLGLHGRSEETIKKKAFKGILELAGVETVSGVNVYKIKAVTPKSDGGNAIKAYPILRDFVPDKVFEDSERTVTLLDGIGLESDAMKNLQSDVNLWALRQHEFDQMYRSLVVINERSGTASEDKQYHGLYKTLAEMLVKTYPLSGAGATMNSPRVGDLNADLKPTIACSFIYNLSNLTSLGKFFSATDVSPAITAGTTSYNGEYKYIERYKIGRAHV